MRSRVQVRKSPSVLVRPSSSPVTHGGSRERISLLPCDRAFVGVPNTALLVYSEPIQHPAESIKSALSRALVHYRHLAGRILRAVHAGEEIVYIACTGEEGVSFVAATSSASVDDVRFFNGSIDAASEGTTWLDDLAAYYPCPDGDRPLVLMQVTEFSCSGYVVGVTWNHGAADGAGMGQFIKAVSDLTRGLRSPSVLPVTRHDEVLAAVVPPSPSLLDIGRHFRSLDPTPDTVFLDVNVPASTIDRVRARCGGGQRTATVFEAVAAVLWQCHTRAIMSVDPEPGASEPPTVLCFSADLRRYAGAKDGYYGNCITLPRATVTGGEVAGGAITEVVRVIQNAKDRIQVPDMSEKQRKLEEMEHLFIVTYWRNLGLDDADFGGGKPARVLSCMRGAVGPPVNIVTGNGEDGGCNILSRCVKEHAQAFLHELATFINT